jgi:hypothetical protein
MHVLQVSVRILGGLMALGYEIGTMLKRSSQVYADETVTVKLDDIEGMDRQYVQIQGKDRAAVGEVGRRLGLEDTYIARSYIEQVSARLARAHRQDAVRSPPRPAFLLFFSSFAGISPPWLPADPDILNCVTIGSVLSNWGVFGGVITYCLSLSKSGSKTSCYFWIKQGMNRNLLFIESVLRRGACVGATAAAGEADGFIPVRDGGPAAPLHGGRRAAAARELHRLLAHSLLLLPPHHRLQHPRPCRHVHLRCIALRLSSYPLTPKQTLAPAACLHASRAWLSACNTSERCVMHRVPWEAAMMGRGRRLYPVVCAC